ncbi:non-homologous end joining protein Ku [Aliirhizobium smilacinae]|jgi:DNA end-binding protein Ku|uniref:Non-homologous end joining protein Ku n=1 Tax=Aliirhizobium smilacinae TaxID=1395944 RepID=A0A5C4XD92_9HYPH|nr:Ku protein [Rhizobium smilacinae]TNM60354.1 Ku protein [Rhizobium smilacinae]
MTSPRANWKGHLRLGEITCPVALYTAASSSERISFNILNRKTGNRVRREFVDSETGDVVEHDDQVKGYETSNGRYVVLEPDEISAAVPASDKTLAITAFIPCDEIDDVYFDKPYYLAPQEMGEEVFALLRDGMKETQVAAIASTVLFRRLRTVLIRPHGDGLIGTTLNFDYEVRPADEVFADVADINIDKEMLDLAAHIIATKKGSYDPSNFDDRYEEALAELVKAKIEGKPFKKIQAPKASKPSDLLQALRDSAGAAQKKPTKRKSANSNTTRKTATKSGKSKSAGSSRRKAG